VPQYLATHFALRLSATEMNVCRVSDGIGASGRRFGQRVDYENEIEGNGNQGGADP
jgi:hypothetical protein